MATKMKRSTVSIPHELDIEILRIKKDMFYDKPKSELIRYLIEKGIEAQSTKENNTA